MNLGSTQPLVRPPGAPHSRFQPEQSARIEAQRVGQGATDPEILEVVSSVSDGSVVKHIFVGILVLIYSDLNFKLTVLW